MNVGIFYGGLDEQDTVNKDTDASTSCKDMPINFSVASEFDNYECLTHGLHKLCDINFHPLSVLRSKQVEGHLMMIPIHIVKSHLACTCKHSGAARQKGMDSTRPNQKYLAAECNFRVNVCLQLRIMKYRITTIHEVHNHPVGSDHYVVYHDQKKLTKKN